MPDKITREQFDDAIQHRTVMKDTLIAYADQQNALYATSMSKAVAEKLYNATAEAICDSDSMHHIGLEWFLKEKFIAIIDSLTEGQ